MSAPHPLNQAVVAQALHDLRNGQLRRCLSMGFSERELEVLKQPALVALLANAQVPWCSVTVDTAIVWRLVNQLRNLEEEIAAVDRMLRLGASTEMVSKFYGLTHQEVALRRDIIGLPKRKGRYAVLSEEQETTLWKLWKSLVAELGIALEDESAMLTVAMELAEAQSVPLSVIWSAIHSWVEQGLV